MQVPFAGIFLGPTLAVVTVGAYGRGMTTTNQPAIGSTMTVTDAQEAPHYFTPGARVRVLQHNGKPAGMVQGQLRPELPAHRWLCRGKSALNGRTTDQWLAAEDLA